MTVKILVAIKWTVLRTEVEPLTGSAVTLDGRFGIDPASEAALEWGLALGSQRHAEVAAVTVGPRLADDGLRLALAAGATRTVRVEGPAGAGSLGVAAAIAEQAAVSDLVILGAWSEDGGSASVPPAVAAYLDRPQACGLLDLGWAGEELIGARRLPAGRRERLRIPLPAVVSVEPRTATLRRASMPAMLAARDAPITVAVPARTVRAAPPGVVEPYRPRPRTMPAAPAGGDHRQRIASLAGTAEAASRAQEVRADPPAAAAAIVQALRAWGYLEDDTSDTRD